MIQYYRATCLAELMNAYRLLETVDAYYPDFGYWFINKVMPGAMLGRDIILVAKDKQQTVGVAIGKRNAHETKLRCVRTAPEYQNRGIGIHLVEKMLRKLDDDKPYCTVAEEMLHQFSRPFINLFSFNLSKVEKGLYRPHKLEYIFNQSSS